MKLLAVIVNYTDKKYNNIPYLNRMVEELKKFKKYSVDIVINSNIPLNIKDVKVNIIKLKNTNLLPLTTRKVIWDNRDKYDMFIYSENDHLFLEKHLDNHIRYSKILPDNLITGLIQYEYVKNKKPCVYYPAYHAHFKWDFNSLVSYNGLKFAHFSNIHQASFILTQKQLKKIGSKRNFTNYMWKKGDPIYGDFKYNEKCSVNTEIYQCGGMKKVICISEFKDNLIHHLPNKYIYCWGDGNELGGHNKEKMEKSLKKFGIDWDFEKEMK